MHTASSVNEAVCIRWWSLLHRHSELSAFGSLALCPRSLFLFLWNRNFGCHSFFLHVFGTSYLDFLGNPRKTIFCFYLNSRVFCSFSIIYSTFGTCVQTTHFLISENYFNIAENMIKQNVIFTRLELLFCCHIWCFFIIDKRWKASHNCENS